MIRLTVEEKNRKPELKLDEKELHHIERYKIESSDISGIAKLSIEMLVKYP